MPIFPSFFFNKTGGYEIEQSLRFDGGAELTRTVGNNGGSRSFTFSVWLKKSRQGDTNFTMLKSMASDDSEWAYFNFGESSGDADQITCRSKTSSGYVFSTSPARKYRDPSSWMHLVLKVDKSANTATGYVNGEQVGGTAGAGGWTFNKNVTGDNLHLGQNLDGYLAEAVFVDNQALNPDSFGEYDNNNVWRPINVSGLTFGTNGWYLTFDPTATNGIGHDHSGNGNNFTPTGFTTSGTGTDVMSDTPTTNFCTWNPLDNAGVTISNGNLDTSSGSSGVCRGTFAVSSGKHYWEYSNMETGTGTPFIMGLCEEAGQSPSGHSNHKRAALFYTDGSGNGQVQRYENGSIVSADTVTVPSGIRRFYPQDVLNIAFDADSGKVWFGKNGSYLDSSGGFTGNPSTGANATITFPDTSIPLTPVRDHAGVAISATANFGQREFSRPPGTVGATDYFNTITWTGDGSNPRTLTGVGFQPDLVWIKGRSVGGDLSHQLFDVARGLSGGNSLQPDRNVAEGGEGTGNGYLSAFTSDGFTVDTTSSDIYVNDSGKTYVAWCWKAGGTASSNTDGSITSQVFANNDAGFSIVTWTGTGANGDYGHGLNDVPAMIIHKRRDSTSDWHVWHKGLPTDNPTNDVIYLNLPDGENGGNNNLFRQDPTDTLIYTGSAGSHNTLNGTYVDYVWTEKTGVSKFGSYDGNGSSDGPVISCGFRPAMVMIKWAKDVSTSESWQIYDNKRGGNPNNTVLAPDAAAQEESPSDRYIQFTADGFQLKSNGQQINRSGAKYIFAAWAATFTAGDFKTLNTANLPAPTVKDGSKNFNTVLYTGTGATQSITGVGFQPDWLWIKARNQSYHHTLTDAVRGTNKQLWSNRTNEEQTNSTFVTSFDSDGFSIGDESVNGSGSVNTNNTTFVAWNWLAGGTGSSNTAGSITSTVSVNPSAGFSISTYSANNTAGATFGHGLGVAPSMVIIKKRNASERWVVYHQSISNQYIYLNEDFAGETSNAAQRFGNDSSVVAPSSTVVTIGSHNDVNGSSGTYVAYCFAEVEGYSKFGSYTGNGSLDGVFNYCGFKPAWLLVKRTNTAANWHLVDSVRSPYNLVNTILLPDLSDQESTYSNGGVDLLSNGFKIRSTGQAFNNSGDSYIFAAFAENPFGGTGVSPATAR